MDNNVLRVPTAQYLGIMHLIVITHSPLMRLVDLIGYHVADSGLEIPLTATLGTTYQGLQRIPNATSDGLGVAEQSPSSNNPAPNIRTSISMQKPRTVAVRIILKGRDTDIDSNFKCENCHVAKKSCDKARPCGRCVKRGLSNMCVDRRRKRAKRFGSSNGTNVRIEGWWNEAGQGEAGEQRLRR